jgi:hypothetical protein
MTLLSTFVTVVLGLVYIDSFSSFIPESLKMTSVDARLDNILKTDWKSKAAELLEERKASGEGPVRLHLILANHFC